MADKPHIKLDSATQAQIRTDGWESFLSGYGTQRDPSTSMRPAPETGLKQQELDDIYRADGIGRRIVDLPAEEMTRQWFNIEGAKGDKRLADLDRINAKQQFNRALRWGGLYGGAIMVLLINDGQGDLAAPLNVNSVRSVDDLIVYDRHQVSWSQADVSDDSGSAYFGRAETMQISPLAGTPFTVHRSRTLIFDGEDVPDRIRQRNDGWGDSRLQSVWKSLGRYAEGMGSTSSILRDFVLPVLGMRNLSQMVGSGQEDVVRKRLDLLGLSKSSLNMMLIDSDNETYEKKASTVSGIDKLLKELKHNVSATCGIPQTKLFGTSPEGMNSTGEGDQTEWYDTVASEQEDKLKPNLAALVDLIDRADGGAPSDRAIIANPLWQMDAQQQATIRKTNVEAATLAVDYDLVDQETAQAWVE